MQNRNLHLYKVKYIYTKNCSFFEIVRISTFFVKIAKIARVKLPSELLSYILENKMSV